MVQYVYVQTDPVRNSVIVYKSTLYKTYTCTQIILGTCSESARTEPTENETLEALGIQNVACGNVDLTFLLHSFAGKLIFMAGICTFALTRKIPFSAVSAGCRTFNMIF